jgi:hypothetical protein
MAEVLWRVLAETERSQATVLRRSLRLRAGARDLDLCFGGEDGAERLGSARTKGKGTRPSPRATERFFVQLRRML